MKFDRRKKSVRKRLRSTSAQYRSGISKTEKKEQGQEYYDQYSIEGAFKSCKMEIEIMIRTFHGQRNVFKKCVTI